jgi:WD40 repeat protein/uncharacterized caspase-like protein
MDSSQRLAHLAAKASAALLLLLLLALPAAAAPGMVVQAPHGATRAFAVSPDGAFWAVAGDRTVKLWDSRGHLLRTFAPFAGDARVVAFSPDGRSIAAADDKALRLYSLNGAVLRELERDYGWPGLAFSPGGERLYATFRQSEAAVLTAYRVADGAVEWKVEQKRNVLLKEPQTLGWADPCVSPDGKQLAVGAERDLRDQPYRSWSDTGPALLVWSAEGKVLREHALPAGNGGYHGPVRPLQWGADGAITGTVAEGLLRWDAALTRAAVVVKGAQAAAVGPGGELFWLASEKGAAVSAAGEKKKGGAKAAPAGAASDVLVVSRKGVERRFDLNRATGAARVYGVDVRPLPDQRIAVLLRTEGSTTDHAAEVWLVDEGLGAARPLGEPMAGVVRVAVSPDGQLFAAGLADGAIDLWSRDGRRIRRLALPRRSGAETSYVTTSVSGLGFSRDGDLLVAGGDQGIRVWNRSGALVREVLGQPGNMDEILLDEGGRKVVIVYGQYAGRRVLALGADGKPLFQRDLTVPFKVSLAPGRGVSINDNFTLEGFRDYGQVERSVVVAWDGAEATLEKPASHPRPAADQESGVVPLGKEHLLRREYGSPVLTIAARQPAPGQLPVHLAATADDWLAWSDDGLFDGSPGATRLLLQVDGDTPYAIDQFALRDNRPDLLLARLGAADPAAQQFFKSLWQRRLAKAGVSEDQLRAGLEVPAVQILDARREGRTLALRAKVTAARAPLARYGVFVNGVPLTGSGERLLAGREAVVEERIALVPGQNQVELSALDQSGAESFRALHTEVVEGVRRGALWVLAFGVSSYDDPALKLDWASKDARDLGAVLGRFAGKGFEKVSAKVLTDAEVTPAALRSAKALLAEARPEDTLVVFIAGHGVHDRDAAATYYYLPAGAKVDDLPGSAITFETVEELLQGVGPRQKLLLMDTCESGEVDQGAAPTLLPEAKGRGLAARALKRIGGAQAAPAGGPPRPYLWQRDRFIYGDLARRSGAVVFSSSRGGELSYERADLQHGVFTFAVLESLQKGLADSDGDGQVSTDELRRFVSRRVAEETDGRQNPTVDRDNPYARFGLPAGGR